MPCSWEQEVIGCLSGYQSSLCGRTRSRDPLLTKSSPDRLSSVTLAPYIITPWLIPCWEIHIVFLSPHWGKRQKKKCFMSDGTWCWWQRWCWSRGFSDLIRFWSRWSAKVAGVVDGTQMSALLPLCLWWSQSRVPSGWRQPVTVCMWLVCRRERLLLTFVVILHLSAQNQILHLLIVRFVNLLGLFCPKSCDIA